MITKIYLHSFWYSKTFFFIGDFKQELSIFEALNQIYRRTERVPNILIFGQSCHAKALLTNLLLQQKVLPYCSSQWRHVSVFFITMY